MKEYYYYWERRTYNALVKMVLRGLLSFKYLLQQPAIKQTPLFEIKSEYEPPHYSTNPGMTEVESFLTKIRSSIIDAAKEFWRWRDGTCLFCEEQKGMNDELTQNYTFKEPVNENPVILRVFYQIAEI